MVQRIDAFPADVLALAGEASWVAAVLAAEKRPLVGLARLDAAPERVVVQAA